MRFETNDIDALAACAAAATGLCEAARDNVAKAVVGADGRLDRKLCDERQFELHGFAWMATYATALHALAAWAAKLETLGQFGGVERTIAAIATAEYCLQLAHGIAMSQDEIVRPVHLRIEGAAAAFLAEPAVARAVREGADPAVRMDLMRAVMAAGPEAAFRSDGLDDVVGDMRAVFRRYADEKIAGPAADWHREDRLIPRRTIDELAELGVFGITVPEEFGGSGMGVVAMCVVTEELSRGYLGVGSIGTRAEIACELIRRGGTEAQKRRYLPLIATGRIIPTAVFTEPDNGSDLGSIGTRAVREGDTYRLRGSKTWITHAARADLMTLMARTDPASRDYTGLTMFLAEKPPGTPEDPFPAPGMSGGEIEVIGYRGMKEYEIAFDGFEVPASHVLGEQEGMGFKQLMQTFETARIQTAARAIGVARNAFDLGYRYATERRQFGRAIVAFPRIGGKLAGMIAELALVRQLTYRAAQRADSGARSDIEAGMAKLLAARLAWSCADNAVQIHGGNGYATEYPISRVLCDARILNIFEGAAEIQAGIIGRGLLKRDDLIQDG